jgi:diguanylate cyclase (GGDEF)-like protein
MRASDVLGRLGGEEFAAVLPGTVADATAAAERVRATFEAVGLTIADCELGATVSIGVASALPGVGIATLLDRADEALYRAKANGRNRVEAISDRPIVPGFKQADCEGAFDWHVVIEAPKAAA